MPFSLIGIQDLFAGFDTRALSAREVKRRMSPPHENHGGPVVRKTIRARSSQPRAGSNKSVFRHPHCQHADEDQGKQALFDLIACIGDRVLGEPSLLAQHACFGSIKVVK